MLRNSLSLLLILALAGGSPGLAAPPPVAGDKEVAKGVKLVDDGDYDAAIVTLDAAARRLATDPAKARELSQAYLYLGIAYVGKGHDAAAKAKFREALAQIKDLTLSADKYPPKVINVFEAAREEAAKAPQAKAPEKGGGSGKTILIIGGAAVAVGAGVAIAASGGSSDSGSGGDGRKTETFGPITLTQFDSSREFGIFVAGNGTLDATATWVEPNVRLAMYVDDPDFNTLAGSNQTGNNECRLTAAVTGSTATPRRYTLGAYIEDSASQITFTVRVLHP